MREWRVIQREREERKVLGEDKREMREDETEGEERRGETWGWRRPKANV